MLSKDKSQTWFNTPSGDVPDIVLPAHFPEDGHPNQEDLQDVNTMEGFFFALFTPNIMNHICEMTNNEMEYVKTVSGNMSQASAQLPVFADTSVKELKAFFGCLVMTGVRNNGHLSLAMMFDVKIEVLF